MRPLTIPAPTGVRAFAHVAHVAAHRCKKLNAGDSMDVASICRGVGAHWPALGGLHALALTCTSANVFASESGCITQSDCIRTIYAAAAA